MNVRDCRLGLLAIFIFFTFSWPASAWEVRPECVKPVSTDGQPQTFSRQELENMFPNRNKGFDKFWYLEGAHVYPDDKCNLLVIGMAEPYRSVNNTCHMTGVITFAEISVSKEMLEYAGTCVLGPGNICSSSPRPYVVDTLGDVERCASPVDVGKLVNVIQPIPEERIQDILAIGRDVERIFQGSEVDFEYKLISMIPVLREGEGSWKLASIGLHQNLKNAERIFEAEGRDWDGGLEYSAPIPAFGMCSTRGFRQYRNCVGVLAERQNGVLQVSIDDNVEIVQPVNPIFGK